MRFGRTLLLVLMFGSGAHASSAYAAAAGDVARESSAARGSAVAARPEPAQGAYLVQTGDLIEFRFPYNHELDFTSPVRPDGGVYFAYIGDVQIGGLTLTASHDLLVSRYRGVLRDPEVFLLLKEYRKPQVYVAGEVPRPGKFDYYRGMSIRSAIFSAGGYADDASQRNAAVIRKASPDSVRLMVYGFKKHHGEAADLLLEPDDIVIVPRTSIAKLGKIIRQYTRDLLPVTSVGVLFRAFGTTAVTVGTTP